MNLLDLLQSVLQSRKKKAIEGLRKSMADLETRREKKKELP
jgi:hypothetical protein